MSMIRNGVDVNKLAELVKAAKADPENFQVKFEANTKWVSGAYSKTKIRDFIIGHRLSPPLRSKPFSVDMWVKGLTIINSDYSFQSLCYS